MANGTGVFWKSRLYDSYVSSHQAAFELRPTAEEMFHPRKAFINSIISKYLPADRSAYILDLGCGHGAFLYFLEKAGYRNIKGIDVSAEQIELAQRLGISEAKQGRLEDFLCSERDGCVDVVLAMDILEHLNHEELFETVDHIRRILKRNGLCIAHVPNAEGIYGMRIRYGDLTHEQAFTAQSASQLFLALGFSEVACYEDKPVVHGLKSLVRRMIWGAGTLPHRALLLAETGTSAAILSQNMLIKARL
jgi:SAM-dependent methyltransferase